MKHIVVLHFVGVVYAVQLRGKKAYADSEAGRGNRGAEADYEEYGEAEEAEERPKVKYKEVQERRGQARGSEILLPNQMSIDDGIMWLQRKKEEERRKSPSRKSSRHSLSTAPTPPQGDVAEVRVRGPHPDPVVLRTPPARDGRNRGRSRKDRPDSLGADADSQGRRLHRDGLPHPRRAGPLPHRRAPQEEAPGASSQNWHGGRGSWSAPRASTEARQSRQHSQT